MGKSLSKEAEQLLRQLMTGLPSQKEAAAEKLGKLGEKHENIIKELHRAAGPGYNSNLQDAAKEALYVLEHGPRAQPDPKLQLEASPQGGQGSTIFCMQCGTQLPGGAKFCFNCGSPTGSNNKNVEIKTDKWEYCEIQSERWEEGIFFTSDKSCFRADAVSPSKGKYVAKRSRTLHSSWPDPEKHERALNEFTNLLVKEGWEPVSERGKEWFSLRFKRVE